MIGRVHDHAPAADVAMALRHIPSAMHGLVACEFVVGVDPVFAGIHDGAGAPEGYHYKDLAHCVYPHNQPCRPASDRGTKVVLPSNRDYCWGTWSGVSTVVHELGHVLHERVGFGYVAEPVTEYATTNHYEAFAEAFMEWIWGKPIDAPTTALLDGLR